MQKLTEEQRAKLKKMGINISGEVTAGRKIVEGDQVNIIRQGAEDSEPATPTDLKDELEKLAKIKEEAEKIKAQGVGIEGTTVKIEKGPLTTSEGDFVLGKRVTVVHKSSGESKG